MMYGVIEIDSNKMHGKPVFAGTNITIQTMFEYFEDGKSLEQFLNDYPGVNKKEAIEVIQMAKLAITSENILKAILQNS